MPSTVKSPTLKIMAAILQAVKAPREKPKRDLKVTVMVLRKICVSLETIVAIHPGTIASQSEPLAHIVALEQSDLK
ncbi:MAG: hypothetical protein L6R35_001592 [Caloplaca aegaea]|nr:MAG: hypothetical protein L6R35_001592 [Caloplaca aegaea]